jgi:hypothetical protein
MDQAGDDLFADSRLAEDQYFGLRARRALDFAAQLHDDRALANQFRERRRSGTRLDKRHTA